MTDPYLEGIMAGVETPADPGVIDLKPYKKVISQRENVHFIGVELTISSVKELIAAVEALREQVAELKVEKQGGWECLLEQVEVADARVTDLNDKLNMHESLLAKSRRETNDACRGLKAAEARMVELREGKTVLRLQRHELRERVVELAGALERALQQGINMGRGEPPYSIPALSGETRSLCEAVLATTPAEALERAKDMRQFIDDFESQFVCWGMMSLREHDEAVQRFVERAAKLNALDKEKTS